jgi:hypothetical protein
MGTDLQIQKINQLTKTWSSPFLYPPPQQQQSRVPPIPSLTSLEFSPSDEETTTSVLFPTLATFPHVSLDVPVKLVLLGSKQVGKSALALRYLTKNQFDNKIQGNIYVDPFFKKILLPIILGVKKWDT